PTVDDAPPPRGMPSDAGDRVSVKSLLDVTTSVTVTAWVAPPLVPLTVSRYEPAAAPARVDTESCDVPVPLTTDGVKEAEPMAVGRPVTDNETLPVKPSSADT